MTALDDIRSRRAYPWPSDHQRMIAALDAVISLVDLADSKGIVSGPPLEVDAIREAIAAALEAGK